MRANDRLREKCAKVGLDLKGLTDLLDVSKTTVDYYWSSGERSYQGEFLPTNKPWLAKLRELLVARGLPREEAEELFGLQRAEDLHDIRELLLKIDNKVDRISADLDARMRHIERQVADRDSRT